ncbi:MAG: hypothetical protein ACP5KG_01415 [Myxococcota bacterium]
MKKSLFLVIIFFIFVISGKSSARTIKNQIIYLGFDAEKKPIIILIDTTRRGTSIREKTDTSIAVKYLAGDKIKNLYEDNFISDTPLEKFGFRKNIIIKMLDQNQIEVGTSNLNYNFNIISLAQKKRATYTKTVNDVNYRYYVNTAFFGKDGPPLKGNLLFLEAESEKPDFDMPEILFMSDNLFRSWLLAGFTKNTTFALFSDSADFFKTSNNFTEINKAISVNMDIGITYNKSALFTISGIKHRLEVNTTSDLEEIKDEKAKKTLIYVFSEGYAYTRDGMTSIFGIRIIKKK